MSEVADLVDLAAQIRFSARTDVPRHAERLGLKRHGLSQHIDVFSLDALPCWRCQPSWRRLANGRLVNAMNGKAPLKMRFVDAASQHVKWLEM